MKSSRAVYPVFITLVILTCLWQLTSFSVLMKWDIMDIALPWRYFVSESVNNGVLPLWNPFMNTGFPQYGDPSTWYWPSWILGGLFGYCPFTIQLEFLLHLVFGALGAFYFARNFKLSPIASSWVGIGFMLSGFVVSNAQHLGWIIGAAYLPWVLTYTLRFFSRFRWSDALGLALLGSLMLSGSYPGMVISTGYLVLGFAIWTLWKNRQTQQNWIPLGLKVAAAVVLVLGLSLVTLISSFDLAEMVNRGGPLPLEGGVWTVLFGSLTPKATLTFLFPYAGTLDSEFWGADLSLINCFMGILPLVFLVLGLTAGRKIDRKFYVFLSLGLFFLMLALAEVFPIRSWLYSLLPFMDLFRFSTFFRAYSIFFLLIASGYSVEHFWVNRQQSKRAIVVVSITGVLIFVSLLIGYFSIEAWQFKQMVSMGFDRFEEVSGIAERAYLHLLFHLGIVVILALLFWKRINTKLLLVVYGIELFVAVQLNGDATIWANQDPNQVEERLAEMPEGFPLPSLQESVQENNDISGNTIGYLWKNLSIYHKNRVRTATAPMAC